MVITKSSPAFSFAGWSFTTWAYKNKDNLKLLVAFLFGYNYFVGFEWTSFFLALLAIVGKLAFDTLDFWLSEVKLQ